MFAGRWRGERWRRERKERRSSKNRLSVHVKGEERRNGRTGSARSSLFSISLRVPLSSFLQLARLCATALVRDLEQSRSRHFARRASPSSRRTRRRGSSSTKIERQSPDLRDRQRAPNSQDPIADDLGTLIVLVTSSTAHRKHVALSLRQKRTHPHAGERVLPRTPRQTIPLGAIPHHQLDLSDPRSTQYACKLPQQLPDSVRRPFRICNEVQSLEGRKTADDVLDYEKLRTYFSESKKLCE